MKKALIVCFALVVVAGLPGCSPEQAANQSPVTITEGKDTSQVEEAQNSPEYNQIFNYMKEESKKAFSAHYELLGFELSDYQESNVDGKVEATFGYKVMYKNFDKDPDTVAYIKEAKEKGDPHYQQLHDEYLQQKEMNFQLKAVIENADSVTLYTNVNPKGIQWEKVVMSDFILEK
ncbi:hypothetical protein AV540_03880 [Brevibacillus parabrevis]|uniref:hypothetical protein n=1 Tax=Brevibacillus parabrevis TaxID=54914 RepID=UPI0007AB71DE|nr:hypothetical protein [Brevibacillus parabrevis]KZE39327.1 hypothetical protein AV540_03880 [Brevibacillus parabrevis]